VLPEPQGSAEGGVLWQSLGGRRYALSPPASPRDPAFPRLPDGSALAAQLYASGYAAAVISREPAHSAELGGVEVDDRPGAALQLETDASWLAAAPLWRGPGAKLLGWLGLGEAVRTPDQVANAARRWLERWRMARSSVPFFLRVDLRGPGAAPRRIDEAVAAILDSLPPLEAGATTLIVLASPLGETGARATLLPPLEWRVAVPPPGPARQLAAGALGAALARAARSSPDAPAILP
jgi:hypothetical protein